MFWCAASQSLISRCVATPERNAKADDVRRHLAGQRQAKGFHGECARVPGSGEIAALAWQRLDLPRPALDQSLPLGRLAIFLEVVLDQLHAIH